MDNLEHNLYVDRRAVLAFCDFKESDLYTEIAKHDVAAENDLWVVFYAGWKASSSGSENCAIA